MTGPVWWFFSWCIYRSTIGAHFCHLENHSLGIEAASACKIPPSQLDGQAQAASILKDIPAIHDLYENLMAKDETIVKLKEQIQEIQAAWPDVGQYRRRVKRRVDGFKKKLRKLADESITRDNCVFISKRTTLWRMPIAVFWARILHYQQPHLPLKGVGDDSKVCHSRTFIRNKNIWGTRGEYVYGSKGKCAIGSSNSFYSG